MAAQRASAMGKSRLSVTRKLGLPEVQAGNTHVPALSAGEQPDEWDLWVNPGLYLPSQPSHTSEPKSNARLSRSETLILSRGLNVTIFGESLRNDIQKETTMNLDQIPEFMTQMTSLQESIQSLQEEIRLVRDDLEKRPVTPPSPQEWFSTSDASKLLQKSEYTVRQWCNEGRINAVKREERRGGSALWKISVEDVTRYKDEGLLPLDPSRNHVR